MGSRGGGEGGGRFGSPWAACTPVSALPPPSPGICGIMSGMTELSSLKGRLLVATPAMADPNFDRAVVLLLDHDEEGSLGVVLNRPTPVDVGDILEGWADLAG